MSLRTIYRRRAEAGLTRAVFRYPFNTTFFNEWSDDVAWLLGLIWSDGNLTRNSVEICSKDRDLMDQVALLIGQHDGVRPKNRGAHWRVVFTDKAMAQRLRLLGLAPNKSFTAPWPNIPPAFQPGFVRGLLDGDGSVQIRNSRVGQQVPDLKLIWYGAALGVRDGLAEWLRLQGIRHTTTWSKSTVWRVSVLQQAGLRALYELMYTEGAITLQRKHQPFKEWFDTPRARSGRPCR